MHSLDHRVSVSARIIDPGELGARIEAIRHDLGHDLSRSDTQLEELSRRCDLVIPALPIRHPGLKGKLAHRLKMVIRRLIYWHTEPSLRTQQHIDRQLIDALRSVQRQVDRLTERIERLDTELDHLGEWAAQHQRHAIVEHRDDRSPGLAP